MTFCRTEELFDLSHTCLLYTSSLTVDGEAEEYTGQLSAGPQDGSYAVTRFYCGGM